MASGVSQVPKRLERFARFVLFGVPARSFAAAAAAALFFCPPARLNASTRSSVSGTRALAHRHLQPLLIQSKLYRFFISFGSFDARHYTGM